MATGPHAHPDVPPAADGGRGAPDLRDRDASVLTATRDDDDLAGEALARARVRARELVGAAHPGGDDELRGAIEDVMGVSPDVVREYAPAQLEALERAQQRWRGLDDAVSSRELGWSAARVALAVSVVLSVVLDVATGPGPTPAELSGWHEWVQVVLGFVGLALVGILIWLAKERYSRGPLASVEQRRAAALTATGTLADELDAALEERWVGPATARLVQSRQHVTFRSELRQVDATSLYGAASPGQRVATRADEVLGEMLAARGGASIGLCGPRGCGKTTLLKHFCSSAGESAAGTPVLGVVIDVPVPYDPEAFLRSLYTKVLHAYEERSGDVRGQPATVRRRAHRVRVVATIAVGGILAVLVVAWARRVADLDPVPLLGDAAARAGAWLSERRSTPIPWLLAGAAVAVLLAATRALRRRRRGLSLARAAGEVDVIRESHELLSADVAVGATSGGSLSFLGTAQVDTSLSRQVSRGATPYPILVEGFRSVLEHLAADDGLAVRIGVDELDKLEPDAARHFLNSLKGLFGVAGTHFIISVSEDAMSDFERRGLPIRDAFDSSLDEIVRLGELHVRQSIDLLTLRMPAGFPLPFAALAHCFAGGLPRELLRAARRLVRINAGLAGPGSVSTLCSALIDEDLTAKSNAIWVQARTFRVEPYSARFRSWLAASDQSRSTPEGLLSTCEQYLAITAVDPTSVVAGAEDVAELQRLDALALEFVGYRYFAVTVLAFFSGSSDEMLRDALQRTAGGLDALGAARVRFADDPRLAWELVSTFRAARDLRPVLATPSEGWRLPAPAGALPGRLAW